VTEPAPRRTPLLYPITLGGAVLCIAAIIMSAFGGISTQDEAWGDVALSALIAFFAFAGIAAAGTCYRFRRMDFTMVLTMLAIGFGAISQIVAVWRDVPLYEPLGATSTWHDWGVVAYLVGLTIAHAGAMLLMRVRGILLRIVQVTAIAGVWFVVGAILAMMFFDDWIDATMWDAELFFLIVTILGLASAVGTIALPIAVIGRTDDPVERSGSMGQDVSLRLGCPKCRTAQTLAPGHRRCASCGAGLFIRIEEPHCECGYLIYRRTGDICPECGRAIPDEKRWREGVDTPPGATQTATP